jgi:NifU-like protein involved in Fe-S cluster formation
MSVYTPAILRLALETARWPRIERPDASAERRAPICGSVITLDLSLQDNRIVAIGMDVRACALGQAASTLFARSALGTSFDDVECARDDFGRWLSDAAASAPAWPDLCLLEPARALTARHGAMLLPFDAALAALSLKSDAL